VLLLTNFDHDLENVALAALVGLLEKAGAPYPYLFALPPNSGLRTGIDLDGDGRAGTARDAQGYGRFPGQGGMALLSRLPIIAHEVEDHSRLLWKNLPGARLPMVDDRLFPSVAAIEKQRLSSTGHWVVPLQLGNGQQLRILAFHATPPVFDGPEDRNGLRNADEIRFWRLYLDGRFGGAADRGAFVILGDANIDPHDGPGRHEAIRGLLADPRVQDPEPDSAESRRLGRQQGGANTDHRGDPGQDTADLPDDGIGPGNLRLDYVLPSADLGVVGAGLVWPEARRSGNRTRHALVWVDIAW